MSYRARCQFCTDASDPRTKIVQQLIDLHREEIEALNRVRSEYRIRFVPLLADLESVGTDVVEERYLPWRLQLSRHVTRPHYHQSVQTHSQSSASTATNHPLTQATPVAAGLAPTAASAPASSAASAPASTAASAPASTAASASASITTTTTTTRPWSRTHSVETSAMGTRVYPVLSSYIRTHVCPSLVADNPERDAAACHLENAILQFCSLGQSHDPGTCPMCRVEDESANHRQKDLLLVVCGNGVQQIVRLLATYAMRETDRLARAHDVHIAPDEWLPLMGRHTLATARARSTTVASEDVSKGIQMDVSRLSLTDHKTRESAPAASHSAATAAYSTIPRPATAAYVSTAASSATFGIHSRLIPTTANATAGATSSTIETRAPSTPRVAIAPLRYGRGTSVSIPVRRATAVGEAAMDVETVVHHSN